MSRERILADIEAALARGTVEATDHPHPIWPMRPPPPWPSLAAEFQARFEALGGKWAEAATPGELVDRVLAVANGTGPGAILVARDPDGELDRWGLPERLRTSGREVLRDLSSEGAANRVCLTITAATRAIAESGTFGLVVAPGQGRLASVIAPVHLTVLTRSRLVPALTDFLAVAGEALAARKASAAILITGPSRTADIEGQLIVGVHGPREVHCILAP